MAKGYPSPVTFLRVTEVLREIFLKHLAPKLRDALSRRSTLDDELQSLVDRAAAAQPGLEADGPGLIAFVAAHLAEDSALEALHAGDLCLAHACLLGDPTALTIFERDVIARSSTVVRGHLPPGLTADEVLQRLRVRLLVRDQERPPGLATYSGRGALVHFSRATTARLIQEFARQGQREVATEESLLDSPALTRDLDASMLKQQFAEAFATAFKAALGQLSARDQHLLRLHYLDGMRAEELGRIFNTHRATVWRWLTGCRERLLEATRAELAKTVKDAELSSLMNALHSQLDVSISRVLRATKGD